MLDYLPVLILLLSVVLVYRFGTTRATMARIDGVRSGRRQTKERYDRALCNLTKHLAEIRHIETNILQQESSALPFWWRRDDRDVLTGYAENGGVLYEAFLTSEWLEIFQLHISGNFPSGPLIHISVDLMTDELSVADRVDLERLFRAGLARR